MGTANKIFWIFFAFALGFILFASIQNKLPPEMAFLRGSGSPATTASGAGLSSYEGWTIVSDNGAVELRKVASSSASTEKPPLLGILCDRGTLGIRLDPQAPAAGGALSAEVAVVLPGATPSISSWYRTRTTNLLAPRPQELLHRLTASNPERGLAQFQVNAKDGTQLTLSLDLRGLSALVKQFPASCQ